MENTHPLPGAAFLYSLRRNMFKTTAATTVAVVASHAISNVEYPVTIMQMVHLLLLASHSGRVIAGDMACFYYEERIFNHHTSSRTMDFGRLRTCLPSPVFEGTLFLLMFAPLIWAYRNIPSGSQFLVYYTIGLYCNSAFLYYYYGKVNCLLQTIQNGPEKNENMGIFMLKNDLLFWSISNLCFAFLAMTILFISDNPNQAEEFATFFLAVNIVLDFVVIRARYCFFLIHR